MKTLRSLLLPAALGAALLAPVAVFAQQTNPPPAPGMAARHWHHGPHGGAMRGLNLSAQQKARIKQIHQQFRQSHPNLRSMSPAARKQAFQQMRSQVMNVLTPQQRTQWQHNVSMMRERRHNARFGLMRGVNLSAQQKAQLKQIRRQFRQSHPNLRSMSPAARKQAFQQMRSQVMNVLTPQQRTQWQHNMSAMRQRWEQRRAERGGARPAPTAPPSN